jgi:hypothetical protein
MSQELNGRDAPAHVAQQLEAHLENVGDVGAAGGREALERLPMHEAVVARVGLGEAGEPAAAPVEIAAVDDDAADRRAVAADVLGGRVDDDVDAPLDRAVEHRRRHVLSMMSGTPASRAILPTSSKGEDVERGIAEALAVERLGVGPQRAAEGVGIGGVDERHLDAELGQRVVEKVVGAAVELLATETMWSPAPAMFRMEKVTAA